MKVICCRFIGCEKGGVTYSHHLIMICIEISTLIKSDRKYVMESESIKSLIKSKEYQKFDFKNNIGTGANFESLINLFQQ